MTLKACPDVGVQYHQNGSPIGSVDNIDEWQICAKECEDSAGCEYWTWWRNTGKCQFLSRKGPTKETINAVSGKKGCAQNVRNVVYVQNHKKTFRKKKRSIGNCLKNST